MRRSTGPCRQQGVVGQRARRHDADDAPFDRALGGGRISHLLADGDRLPELDQSAQVLLDRVEGHARHADGRAVGSATRGQRQVQQARRFLGVLVEQLVEISHAVEEQHGAGLGLEAQVLLHHRGVGGGVGFSHAGR